MPNLPEPNVAGMPQYSVPFLQPSGNTVTEIWYRFLRRIANAAVGAPVLIQGALVDRPPATEFLDGSVLFIDTGTSFMYYVESSAWVKVLT